MIRRTAKIFLEFLAGLVAGGIILSAAAAWWLSSGPIPLTFLRPYIEEALSPTDSTITVEIEGTELRWAGWERVVDLRVSDVKVLDFERRVIAKLPLVSLGLSLRALLHGRVSPTYIEIIHPSVSVTRNADGGFAIGLASESNKGRSPNREYLVLERLIAELLSEPDLSRPLGYLKRVGIVEGDLILDDRKLGRVWQAPRADIHFERNALGITANADVDFDVDGVRNRIRSNVSYETVSGIADGTIWFTDFDPAPFLRGSSLRSMQRLADLGLRLDGSLGVRMTGSGALRSIRFDLASDTGRVNGEVAIGGDGYGVSAALGLDAVQSAVIFAVFPELTETARVDTTLDGTVTVVGTTEGDVMSLEFDLKSGAGIVVLPQFYSDAVSIKSAQLRGQISDNLHHIDIEDLAVSLEKGAVSVRATATRVGDDLNVRMDGAATGFDASMMQRYWPLEIAADARAWVVPNIAKGRVDSASMSMVARFPDGDMTRADIESLNGAIRVRGAEINYLSPLPAAGDVDADMTFTEKRFDIAISDGRLRDLKIDEGSVVITGLDSDDQDIAVNLVVRGPLGTALAILDSKPLGFISNMGMNAASISGQAAARLVFEFPLRKHLRIDQVAVAAGATLRDVALQGGPFGISVSDGALGLQLTGIGMAVSGAAKFNDVPIKLNWEENFSGASTFDRRFTVTGAADAAARKKLGIAALPVADGAISGEVVYTEFSDNRSETVARVDLTKAMLDFPLIRWHKAVGIPANLYVFAIAPPDGELTVDDLRLDAADLHLAARLQPTADLKGVRLVEFRNLDFSGNRMQGRIRVDETGGLDVELAGERIDIEPFLSGDYEVDASAEKERKPLHIKAQFKDVQLGEGQSLKDVNAFLVSDGVNWRQIGISAGIDKSKKLAVKFVPKGEGATLLISTQDAGSALQAANWTSRITGGRLLVTGTQAAPGAPIVGEFNLKEFKVSDAPALARVLQVLSLTGIFSALGEKGLDFVLFDGNFRYYGGTLEIKNARAVGSTIGITTEGAVYVSEETADLTGTIVPAYTINSVLGNIPVLGTLLTGGKNEGIFAANYVVKGKLEDPHVSVNPLSALAPGFLRNLISGEVKPLTGEDLITPSQ